MVIVSSQASEKKFWRIKKCDKIDLQSREEKMHFKDGKWRKKKWALEKMY